MTARWAVKGVPRNVHCTFWGSLSDPERDRAAARIAPAVIPEFRALCELDDNATIPESRLWREYPRPASGECLAARGANYIPILRIG